MYQSTFINSLLADKIQIGGSQNSGAKHNERTVNIKNLQFIVTVHTYLL
jgi:hypothetical protein